MSKPVVHYSNFSETNPHVIEGGCAYLDVVDHPRFPPNHFVKTSRVLSFDSSTGVIETLNMIYKPVEV